MRGRAALTVRGRAWVRVRVRVRVRVLKEKNWTSSSPVALSSPSGSRELWFMRVKMKVASFLRPSSVVMSMSRPPRLICPNFPDFGSKPFISGALDLKTEPGASLISRSMEMGALLAVEPLGRSVPMLL